MSLSSLQLRLWCPTLSREQTLEICERWEEVNVGGEDIGGDEWDVQWTGWDVFWHGDLKPTSFDPDGKRIGLAGSLHEMLAEAGCTAPADLMQILYRVFTKCESSDLPTISEPLSTFINDLTARRAELEKALP